MAKMVCPRYRLEQEGSPIRTRQSICAKKVRYRTEEEALLAASQADFPLRPYRCDRCFAFHLTGKTKGKRVPQFALDRIRANPGGEKSPD